MKVWAFTGKASMKKKIIATFSVFLVLIFVSSCNMINEVEKKAAAINKYEKVALNMIKQNRFLQAEINKLKYDIEKLKSKNQFLQIQLDKKGGRKTASIPSVSPGHDVVDFGIYKWSPSQLMTMAETEFDKKNYEKSAQFFKTFLVRYPRHGKIDDRFLFQAGIASFESGRHYDWALDSMKKLIVDHPTSKYYRGAKLWVGLIHLKIGRKDLFFDTVEEFRKKYRNTPEWKILSFRYEEIVQKFKN